jgi:hypothetical protein
MEAFHLCEMRSCGGLFEIWPHINVLIEALHNCAAECYGGVFMMWPVIWKT